MKSVLLAAAILGLGWAANARADEAVMPAGAAAVDITPDYPVRLSGFGFRRAESEGVTQRIRAKALAFSAMQRLRSSFYPGWQRTKSASVDWPLRKRKPNER